ncbi:uncharacterized protein LOC127701991 [Mytilus californianus]|uniref:uncharacterized protein LOC127701991 n=1 Tax=Mytilus californianus TaxID=6549 RepID=UPI002244FCA2|nr:uncharacterized protein LOC127701991 [Mytilus californianus]
MNPTSVDTIDADARSFRVRTLRILGGTQIALGIVCAILSLVGVAFDGVRMNKNCPHHSNSYYYYMYNYGTDSYYYYTDCTYYWYASTLFGFNITCLIFSGWCLLTGIFPFCMNKKRRNSWRCLKITFMVCCIIGAAVFMPTIFSLGVIGALMRAKNESGGLAALPSFLAVVAVLEMVVAIIASAYCCCCTSWGSSNQLRYVYVANGQNGMILNMPLSQLNTGQLQRFAVPTQLTHVPSGITPQSQNLQNMQTFHAQLGHASALEATPPVYPSSASMTTTQQENQALGNCTSPPPYKE